MSKSNRIALICLISFGVANLTSALGMANKSPIPYWGQILLVSTFLVSVLTCVISGVLMVVWNVQECRRIREQIQQNVESPIGTTHIVE